MNILTSLTRREGIGSQDTLVDDNQYHFRFSHDNPSNTTVHGEFCVGLLRNPL